MLAHDVGAKMTGATGVHLDVPAAVRAGTLTTTEAADNACAQNSG
jgi:hypothetical protein